MLDTAICKASAKATRSPSRGKSPASSRTEFFSMGPDWGAWRQLRQDHFQPMYQTNLIPRAGERQIHSPISNQCLQPTGPKPKPSQSPQAQGRIASAQPTGMSTTGSIRGYLPQWEALTQDQWIHQVVKGYEIELSSPPPDRHPCPPYQMDRSREETLNQEVTKLIQKGVVEEVQLDQLGFSSPMLVVPKKGGKWRPVINLRLLNQYVVKPHFKMEDIRSLKDIIQEGDQIAKLDLKDAYFSVPMAQNSKRLLQFQWKSQLLQFTCLPFGLSSAPYVFTKLLRPVLTSLRDQGIRCLMYLDDMLILGKTPQELNHNFCLSKSLLTTLGFSVNEEKSSAGPTQELEFLGFLIDSKQMTLSVTEEKLRSLISQCKRLLGAQQTTIRQLAHVIGLMTSMKPTILPAPLHYRALQELKNTALSHYPMLIEYLICVYSI